MKYFNGSKAFKSELNTKSPMLYVYLRDVYRI